MRISPEHRPSLRAHCSRSEVALNGPAAVTDRILLGLVHHLRHVAACSLYAERHLTAIEMNRALVHRYQRPIGDHAVDLGHPLHDADAYLRRLGIASYGLVVVCPEQYLVPQGEQRPEVSASSAYSLANASRTFLTSLWAVLTSTSRMRAIARSE